MTEYIVELNNNAVSGGKFLLGTVYLDAQEIVRCRDCMLYDTHTEPPCCYRDSTGVVAEPDGFCKWGVRRES